MLVFATHHMKLRVSLLAAFANCSKCKEALINELSSTKQSVSDENALDHFPQLFCTCLTSNYTPGLMIPVPRRHIFSGFASKLSPVGHPDKTWLAYSNTLSVLIIPRIVFSHHTSTWEKASLCAKGSFFRPTLPPVVLLMLLPQLKIGIY